MTRTFLACAALLVALPVHAQNDGGTMNLGVGEQKTLSLQNVARVAIGDPGVADVKQVGGGGELLLTGVGEGRTSLLVWLRNDQRLSYAISVRKQDPREVVSEVRALLGDRDGIRIRIVEGRVFLEGETLTAEDAERVQQVVSLYPQVKSFVRPSANARRLAAESLTRALQKAGLKGAQATVVGSTLFLEGWVESKEDLAKADLVVRASGEKAENLLTIGVKRMVLVEVEFAEVSYGALRNVGVKFPTTFASTGSGITYQVAHAIPGGTTQSIAATLSATTDFSATAVFDDNYVRVLAQPRLLAASGEKAEFLAGGEVPILMVTQNQFNVQFKKFGVLLNITPTADRSGNIGTEIYAEVSDVDRSLSVRANGFDVPGFRTRNVKTSVTVKDGETIILSGLFNNAESKEVSKVPLLGHIPILGELFKSRSFADNKTELAIYVTPRIASPTAERTRRLIDDARRLYRESQGSVSFSIFD
ncbi:MAG TPA: pilus assembly protein N-terminal domain-containing protein [Myxococcales bacterium]|nr:pilus assembly protein N-terminal domain-containing protein [Myxococcales bacterium]